MASLSELDLSPEGLAFDPATGDAFMLNDVGLSLLKSLQAGSSEDQAAGMLIEEYQVPRDQAVRDVADFQERLRILHLL
jgi:hypothetical protein